MSNARSFGRFFPALLGMSFVAVGVAGCGARHDQQPGTGEQATGHVGLALQIAPSISIGKVTWTIANPTLLAAPLTGTVDVSQSSTLQFVVGGLPAGGGYTITLTAITSTGLNCSGSAMFSITPNVTTPVTVDVVCGSSAVDAGNNGSAAVNGMVTLAPPCAAVTGVSASPTSANVGGAISLQAQGVDSSGSSSDVAFSWAVTGGTGSGTLSGATGATPTFTCTSPGPVTVTVAASVVDGGGASCTNNTASVQLTCTGSSTASSCAGDLSNIGTGDFHISLALTTLQNNTETAVLNQRSFCGHSNFWDLHLLANGTLQIETDDTLVPEPADYTVLPTTGIVNVGIQHQVLVDRVGGMLTISLDGVSSGPVASVANFGTLAPLQAGTDVCVQAGSGEVNFVGTIANCVASP
jgi:hypothetical protein